MKTKYFFGNYEKEITSAGTRELNTIPGFDGNYALIVKDNNGQRNIFYVYTDHLGSTNVVSDAAGNPVERHSFDAWGRERSYEDWSYVDVRTGRDLSLRITDRGHTGHEMLPEFNLINMNGRLYDPVLGRMLSPDPFVQAPGNTQNYNRYSYVLNNPLKYTDPSGYTWWSHFSGWVGNEAEKINQYHKESFVFGVGAAYHSIMGIEGLIGFIDGYFSQSGSLSTKYDNGSKEAVHKFNNLLKIVGGQFQADPNASWEDRQWQRISRQTWESTQNILGLSWNILNNNLCRVEDVQYFHGATYVAGAARGGNAVTLGSYISISPVEDDNQANIEISQFGHTTMHEYGHYIQSQKFGPLYLTLYGIPSAGGAEYTEHNANTRGNNYFHNIDNSFIWIDDGSLYRKLNSTIYNPSLYDYLFGIPILFKI